MPDPFSILSTKTLHDAVRQEILSLGWKLREEEFIDTLSLFSDNDFLKGVESERDRHRAQIEAIRQVDAQTIVIFTSEKALLYLPHGVRDPGIPFAQAYWPGRTEHELPFMHPYFWNIGCLSGRTRETILETMREEQVVCTAGNARDLAKAIVADGRFTKAVFFCALAHRPDLPEILRGAGIAVEEIPVYKTVGQPKTIHTPFNAVLFFSPSAVEQFFQLNSLAHGTVCFAIGETTAEAVRDYTDERVIASPTPTQEELLRCVRFYYDNQQCYE